MKRYEQHMQLSPPVPTRKKDLCGCPKKTPIKLMYAFTYNPIACINCNREIPLERITFPRSMVFDIAQWREIYGAMYWLWIDSGEYEKWALRQLLNIHSPVNIHGLELNSRINKRKRCYYWLHQDESRAKFTPISLCPKCGKKLEEYCQGKIPQLLCCSCRIIMSGQKDG